MPVSFLLIIFSGQHAKTNDKCLEQLDKPLKNGRTHRWRVFVRAPDGYPAFEDRSFIKKVTFQLHATYREPKRSIRLPPFG